MKLWTFAQRGNLDRPSTGSDMTRDVGVEVEGGWERERTGALRLACYAKHSVRIRAE